MRLSTSYDTGLEVFYLPRRKQDMPAEEQQAAHDDGLPLTCNRLCRLQHDHCRLPL